MKKGDAFITKDREDIYRIVGWWGDEVVLAHLDPDKDDIFIYTPSELESFVADGRFRKLFATGKKLK